MIYARWGMGWGKGWGQRLAVRKWWDRRSGGLCCYCCSVPKSCPTLCDPIYCSMPGSSVFTISQVCSNSRPLSWWCYLTISSSATLYSSCRRSFPAPGSFSMSWFFTSDGQSAGASASASVLPMNIQSWFPLGLTGLISLHSKGLSSLLRNQNLKTLILLPSTFFMVQLSHLYMITEKPWLWLYGPLWAKWCLCFLMCV